MSAAVGADIAALCSKCGDVWHVIVAKVGESIVKVQCKECGGYHRYRTAAGKAATVKRTSNVGKPKVERVVERFDQPSIAADLSRPVRNYAATERFEPGDRLEHPTFGQGTVETVDGAKMTVFFVVGRKVLVHAKGDAARPGSLTRPKPFDNSGPQAGKPVGQE